MLVDKECVELVKEYRCKRTIVDDDVDGKSGEYEDVVARGRQIDVQRGGKGWDDLVIDDVEETDTMVLNCTSGTTSNPKVASTENDAHAVCRNYLSGHLPCGPDKYHRIWIEFSNSIRPRSV